MMTCSWEENTNSNHAFRHPKIGLRVFQWKELGDNVSVS